MTLEDLKKIPTLQTSGIAAASKDPKTALYIVECLRRFWAGDYGEVPPEDTAANNADLEAGEGHVLARYKQAEKLEGDIYIEAHFYAPKLNDLDYTNTLVMYPYER